MTFHAKSVWPLKSWLYCLRERQIMLWAMAISIAVERVHLMRDLRRRRKFHTRGRASGSGFMALALPGNVSSGFKFQDERCSKNAKHAVPLARENLVGLSLYVSASALIDLCSPTSASLCGHPIAGGAVSARLTQECSSQPEYACQRGASSRKELGAGAM